MKSYIEFQKEVFDWLMEKNTKDPTFTFSLRQVASKGAERNYFIGTERSKYFGTTFWTIPVNFPGSASDLINLMFKITDDGYLYYLQFSQTRSPNGSQNDYALEFIRNLKPALKERYTINENAPTNKMEYYNIPPKRGSYDSIEELLSDVESDIDEWLRIIDAELSKFKEKYKSKFPEFNAHRITKDEFEVFISKLNARLSKYSIVSIDSGANKDPVVESEIKKVEETLPKRELNQILYGPPGTGKTYNSINKAISIIENSSENELLLKYPNRAFLKKRFLDLIIDDFSQDEGQIAFVTFHQSMSYEDFIEGIKPIVVGEKNERKVVYDTLPGIFKQICTLAKENWLASQRIVKNISTFDEVFEIFKDEVEENDEVSIPMKTEGKNYTIYGFTKSSINFRKASGNSSHTLSISTLRDYYYGIKEIRPHGLGIYYPSLIEKLRSYKPIVNIAQNTKKNYVLVIDEINRGNVSQIFGELITLIEEDKRLGKEEALEVTLPYSKEKFGVPPNLYIIGTMNTADRSVEALDAALRRRFSFEEMFSKPGLIKTNGKAKDGMIEDVDLVEILETINKRIEKLLDKDHQIGHSYFMCVSNLDDLKSAFYNKIIPLLQEYFFGDYGKIGLVLGDSFVRKEVNDSFKFATFKGYENQSDLLERPVYTITNSDKWDFKSIYE